MELNSPKPQDIVDTTDSLEAIEACKSMKNFLFLVVLICLLLTQLVFWMNNFGLIHCSACLPCAGQPAMQGAGEPCGCDTLPASSAAGALPLDAAVNLPDEVEKVVGGLEQNAQQAEAIMDKDIILVKETDNMPAEIAADQAATELETKNGLPFRIPCCWVIKAVAACNFLVIPGSILYCLTLLMCLKISLTGRLGGINHIARAFFISLLLMVILIPWQQVLPCVLAGTVWLPGELLCGGWAKSDYLMFWKVLYYIRFVGLWVVAMWFLLWAQIRSAKWSRTTLRRLGIVR